MPLRLGDLFALPADLMFAVRLTQCWIRRWFSLWSFLFNCLGLRFSARKKVHNTPRK